MTGRLRLPFVLRGALLAASAATLAASPLSAAVTKTADANVRPALQSFESRGAQIPVEIRSKAAAPAPAILILPGRSGLAVYRSHVDDLADALVKRGYVVLIPLYLGKHAGDVPQTVDRATFDLWRERVRDALAFAASRPDVDAGRIGVAAFSLGGFAASVEAASNRRIRALAVNSAGLSDFMGAAPARMPPTLVIHARNDPVAPLHRAEALVAAATRAGALTRLRVYDSNDHILTGTAWSSSVRDMIGFFDQALAPPKAVAKQAR